MDIETIPASSGDPRSDVDHTGAACTIVDFAVNSLVLEEALTNR